VLVDPTGDTLWMLILPTGTAAKVHNCTPRGMEGTDIGAADAVDQLHTPRDLRVSNGSNGSGHGQLLTASSPAGPWSFAQQTFPPCNNPTGAYHPNGTLYLLCHGGTKGYGVGFMLQSSDNGWAGPWTNETNILRGNTGRIYHTNLCEVCEYASVVGVLYRSTRLWIVVVL
jgi:hypothetical protein